MILDIGCETQGQSLTNIHVVEMSIIHLEACWVLHWVHIVRSS